MCVLTSVSVIDGGADIAHGVGFPTVHDVYAGELTLIEIDIVCTDNASGVIHALQNKLFKVLGADAGAVSEAFREGDMRGALIPEMAAQCSRRSEQIREQLGAIVFLVSILMHMEDSEGVVFLRTTIYCESLSLYCVIDICTFLLGNILTVQFIEACLHHRLRISAALIHHALQRSQSAFVHPRLEGNIVSHFAHPPLPARQQNAKASQVQAAAWVQYSWPGAWAFL